LANPAISFAPRIARDFAIPPPDKTLLDTLKEAGFETIGVGKIASIFDFIGLTGNFEAHDNAEAIDRTLKALGQAREGLIFTTSLTSTCSGDIAATAKDMLERWSIRQANSRNTKFVV